MPPALAPYLSFLQSTFPVDSQTVPVESGEFANQASPNREPMRPSGIWGDPKRVLVFRTGTLGDTVCAIPAFRLIRRNFPHAELTLLSDMPARTNVAAWDVVNSLGIFDYGVGYRTGGKLSTAWELFRIVRKLRPELLIQLPQVNQTSRQLASRRRFFDWIGVRNLCGFRAQIHPAEWVPREADRLIQVLNKEGILGAKPEYEIPINPDALERVNVLAGNLGIDLQRAFLVFCGGGKTATQRWPLERYAAVLRILSRDLDLPVIAIGGPRELKLYRRLVWPAFPDCQIPGDSVSLPELFELLRFATAYVGNDTGPMHVAASVACPVLAIISARNRPGLFDPDANQSCLIRHRTPCEGCRLEACFENRHRCLLEISVRRVLDESSAFLKSVIASERQRRLESLWNGLAR